ncbi:MAG: hypothetical protein P1V97_19080 [Planctomycetota bacterium]|nr:hypothetical protein [Planctomycetota bacterium]
MANLRLVLRFLSTRWWEEVSDLVDGSLEKGVLLFEDLDLDLDLLELSRVLNIERRLELIEAILFPGEDLNEALTDEADPEAAHAFLILMAINLAIFDGAEAGRDLVWRYMHSEDSAFTDLPTFARLLPRVGPLSKAKAWVEEQVSDAAEKSALLETMVTKYHAPDGFLLHLEEDRQGSEKALGRQFENRGFQSLPWEVPMQGPRVVGVRRMGRFTTFLLDCSEELANELALSLSQKNVLSWSLLADFRKADAVQIREYKGQRIFRDQLALSGKKEGPLDREEALGILLSMGIRIYDPDFGRPVSTLSYKEVLLASSKEMGLVRRFSYQAGEPPKRGRTKKRKR